MNAKAEDPKPANGDVVEEAIRLEGFGPQDLYQRREKIFTRYVGGVFQKLRFYTGWPLLVGYFATPWLMWGDRQAILFDLPARQFHLLGLTVQGVHEIALGIGVGVRAPRRDSRP